jgi:hypothetical protein
MVFVTLHLHKPHKLQLRVIRSADIAVQACGPKYVGGMWE